MKRVQFVGLDVHADTIAVAVAEPDGTVRSVGVIPNRPESIRKLVKRLGSPDQLRACYEAGPTGYVLYWQLTALGVRCEVVAPTLVPVKAGDRVKTDRRDALKLARSYRAGDLTPVWVPDAAHEALRDVVRAREAAKKDQLRARHRLGKFLLRHGRRPPTGITRWTQRYLLWVKGVRFAEAAQEATLLDATAMNRSSLVISTRPTLDFLTYSRRRSMNLYVRAAPAIIGLEGRGPLDGQVARYVRTVANWATAPTNGGWSATTSSAPPSATQSCTAAISSSVNADGCGRDQSVASPRGRLRSESGIGMTRMLPLSNDSGVNAEFTRCTL